MLQLYYESSAVRKPTVSRIMRSKQPRFGTADRDRSYCRGVNYTLDRYSAARFMLQMSEAVIHEWCLLFTLGHFIWLISCRWNETVQATKFIRTYHLSFLLPMNSIQPTGNLTKGTCVRWVYICLPKTRTNSLRLDRRGLSVSGKCSHESITRCW